MENLWLIGMMGSGKTSVGKGAAAARRMPFVDVDGLVEKRAGKSIPDIFRQDGEGAFRRLETAEVRRLAEETAGRGAGRVIATGGGAVLDERSAAAMRRTGAVVWLDAPPAVLAGRAEAGGRPLLGGPGGGGSERAAERLSAIHEERRPLYEGAAHYRLDAARPLAETTARAAEHSRTAAADSSEILIGRDMPRPLLPRREDRERAVVIAQAPVLAAARRAVEGMRYTTPAVLIEVPDREEAKTLAALGMLYERLAQLNLGRHDTIVGVGGGAVTDAAGFAAATWLRGIESVMVPTTLLGAVDASIGGKTGINVLGKNLVGAFWHPARVAVSLDILFGLPDELVREGLAETVKAGFIADPGLVELLAAGGKAFPGAEAVRRAAAVKAAVVSEDFREAGRRAILNFGHTIGHGIETVCGLPHGYAVSVGMAAAAAVSADRHGFDPDEVIRPLERLGLPTRVEQADRTEIRRFVYRDKKRTAAGLRMVLLRRLGDPVVEQVDDEALDIGLDAIGLAR